VNWDAIGAYLRAARASSSLGAGPPADADALRVDMRQVMAYRAKVQDLGSRLDPGDHTAAAYGGLQDSAPRAALYGLHARMQGVGPDDWEHPSLVQIWFRLGADYVIPRDAADVFTVGTWPSDNEQVAALNALGDMVREVVARVPMRTRDVQAALGSRLPEPFVIRIAQVSGRVRIRWDARTTEIIAADDPAIDVDDARLALARRFIHWYGPVGPAHLAKWATIPKVVVRETWERLVSELVPVDVEGRARWILATDEPVLRAATPPIGARLLPGGLDPYLYVEPPGSPSVPKVGRDISQRLVNSLTGRILLDGEFVGSWGRVQQNVTVHAWRELSDDDVDRITGEVASFSGPLGKPAKLRWV